MANRTASKTKATKTETPRVNIPSAVRGSVAPTVTGGQLDLLGQLIADTSVPTSNKPKTRPSMKMSEQTQELFNAHILAKVLADHFGTHDTNLADQLKGDLFVTWIETLWALRTQPANPTLKTSIVKDEKFLPHCEGQFQVQTRFKIEADNAINLVELLVATGMSEDNAKKLVKENINFTPSTVINFNRLQVGQSVEGKFVPATDEEKAVANHALSFLLSIPGTLPLTKEEKALLIDQKPNIKVLDGFLERICGYLEYDINDPNHGENAIKQLTAIFTVFKPTLVAKGAKFGISDTLTERNDRLIDGARQILGISEEDDRRHAEKVLGLTTDAEKKKWAKELLKV